MASVINKKIKVPLHYQIYLDLLKKIQGGELRPGQRIPSESELERIYDVSRVTVRGAIEMLAQEGLVEKNRGKKGTVVCHAQRVYDIGMLTSFTDDIGRYKGRTSSELLHFRVTQPGEKIASLLKLGAGEEVYYVERVRFCQEVHVGLRRSYIRRLNGLALTQEELGCDDSMYALLRRNGIAPATATELLEVKIPDEEVLGILELEPHTAVFYKERVAYSEEGEPFEYAEMFYNAEYYQYKVEIKLNGGN